MFAHDRGWLRRMKEADQARHDGGGRRRARAERHPRAHAAPGRRLLARAAARPRRAVRPPAAHPGRAARARTASTAKLPHDTMLVARTMGPADLLDYDRSRLRGLVLEDSGGQSHVAIVARALGIAAVGHARGVMERVDQGNPIIVDADSGEVHIRPTSEVIAAYGDKARFRARRQRKYRALRDRPGRHQGRPAHRAAHQRRPADGRAASGRVGRRRHRPVPHRAAVHGVGDAAAPRAADADVPRRSWSRPASKPVVFRTLDVGGDKVLPYLRQPEEENPALGWRAIRLSLDRPGPAAHPGARAAAGHGGPGAAPAAADGDRPSARSTWRAPSSTASSSCCAGAALPGPTARAARRHDRGAVAALRARRPAAARRFRLGRQQRPAAVPLRRRPQQHARVAARYDPLSAAAAARARRHRRAPPSATTARSACAARWRAGRSRRWR